MEIKNWKVGALIAFYCCAAVIFVLDILDSHQDVSSKVNIVTSVSADGPSSEGTTPPPLVSRPKKITGSGVLLDTIAETINRPVSLVDGHSVAYSGKFAKARIQAGSQVFETTPNQLGNFQRILIGARQMVNVQVAYPENKPGDQVVIEVKDGGHLNDGQMAEVTSLDDQNNLQFQFQSTASLGIYRISLRSGSDVKIVNFWVGAQTVSR